jgi:NADH:ubiquinone oxidoreductase subunit 5 (subunit L)/multisubunit Na+/H+ antiporter MnhA subunit
MIAILITILPILTALACLGLNRAVPTRLLGVVASSALLICGAALLVARLRGGLPLVLVDRPWMAVGNRPLQLTLVFDALNWAPALLGLWGGGLALLALALLVPANLRGFGGLVAAAQLAVVASAIGMANQTPLMLPFAWSLTALLAFLALRASGAQAGSDAPVIVLLAGLSGALLALGAALEVPNAVAAPLGPPALAGWVALSLLVLGAPPFQAPQQRLAEAPAALAGLLMTLGLPLLGGLVLLRFWSGPAVAMPSGWRVALLALGVLTLLICAAGAVGATQLRRRLSWQFSAQHGLLLIALGRGGAVLAAAAPMLLANAVVSTLVCFLAVALLERRAGTDDMAAIALREPLRWPGALYSIGAASAIGLPGFWGLWPRRWLIEDLLRAAPWAVAPLLAGSALLAITFVSALAVFWRPAAMPAAGDSPALQRERPTAVVLIGALVALPLVVFGVAPQLVWAGWLAATPIATSAPALPGRVAQLVCAIAAVGLIVAPLALRLRRGGETVAAAVIAPSALGQSLGGLAWLGAAASLFAGLWHALLRGSRLLLRGLVLFEQRYYLAGLLIAVIVVIMLFIQS